MNALSWPELLHQLPARFRGALAYFTRLPLPGETAWDAEQLPRATCCFPLIGWVVGLAGALTYTVAAEILPVSLAVVLSIAVTMLVTGAMHEDGFADVCDGLGGGWDKERILAIMKDSRLGSFGGAGLILMLLGKTLALIELGEFGGTYAVVAALLAGHVLSRLAATLTLHRLPYARSGESKAAPLVHPLSQTELVFAALCAVPVLLLKPAAMLSAVLLAGLLTVWLARLFRRRIGGVTGDCLGAVQQLTELVCYLAILATWNSI